MRKRIKYSSKLSKLISSNAKGKGNYHVISSLNDKWSVVQDGSGKALRTFSSKNQAVSFAKKSASKKNSSEVLIHGKDGSTKEKIPA